MTLFFQYISTILNTLFFIQDTEPVSDILLFFGRFHPLILHLPIGGLVVVFYMDILGRIKKQYPEKWIKNGLAFCAISAIIACILGYLLSLEGGYEENTTNIHMWTGIGTAVLISGLFAILKYNVLKKAFLPLFIATLVLISVAGHYGSILTHGDNFLTQYSPLKEEEKKPETIAELQYYNNVVQPIFESKCIQCHNTTKKKGDLSLLTEADMLLGGDEGPSLVVGNSERSNIIKRILLPLEDEEHMPPKGKNQITDEELWLLQHWLDNGATFTEKAIAFQNDTLTKYLDNYIEKEKIPEASIEALNHVIASGFSVNRVAVGQPKLSAKFSSDSITKNDIKSLKNIAEQLVKLELNGTNLTDAMTAGLESLKEVRHLRLDNTLISNRTLEHLSDLKNLKILNLHNTDIDNDGLKTLVDKGTFESIYVWGTKVEPSYANTLQKASETTIYHNAFVDFAEIKPLNPPTFASEQTIFSDSMRIEFTELARKSTKLYVSFDETEPDSTSQLYTKPIPITKTTRIKAKLYQDEWLPSPTIVRDFFKIKYKVKDFDIVHKPSVKYPNAEKMFDFIKGSTTFSDGKWTGYEGDNMITTINFDKPQPVENVSVGCLRDSGSWILFPKKIEVFAGNTKTNLKKIGETHYDATHLDESGLPMIKDFKVGVSKTEAKHFKVVVHNAGKLPEWHQGAGRPPWVFVDEVILQ